MEYVKIAKVVYTMMPTGTSQPTKAELTERVRIPTTPETLARMVGQQVTVKRER